MRKLGLLSRFKRSQAGVAAVEFALILPVMLLVYIGSVEAGTLISMDRRVQSISGTVGDLVARSNTSFSAAEMEDYFKAAKGIMAPHSPDDVQQVVTAVAVDTNGKTKVLWSRQYVDGKYAIGLKYPINSSFTLPDSMIDISKDNTVIVAEASFVYKPITSLIFKANIQLFRQTMYLPRFEGGIVVRN